MEEPLLAEHKAREKDVLDAPHGYPHPQPGYPQDGDMGAATNHPFVNKPKKSNAEHGKNASQASEKDKAGFLDPQKPPHNLTDGGDTGAAPNHSFPDKSLKNSKKPDGGKSQAREEDKAGLHHPKKPPHNQTDGFKKSEEETAESVSQPSEEDGSRRKARSLDPKKDKDAHPLSPRQEITDELMNAQTAPHSQPNEETDGLNGQETPHNQPNEVKPPRRKKLPRWQRLSPTTRHARRFFTAISAREPRLPVYNDHEKQLVDKREVFYALALATPVGILTAAAGLQVFQGGWAMVAGASAGVWILAAGGMVLNQYTVLDWERLAARHLGRLGMLGAAVLFIFFTYRAFFPATSWALWLLLLITAVALGVPWILSCVRGDDDVTLASARSNTDAAGRAARRRTI